MEIYKYVGEDPLDFICNGVPSHLHYDMIIKPSLINYMVENHPTRIRVIEEETQNDKRSVEIKKQKKSLGNKDKVLTYTKSVGESELDEDLLNEVFFDKKEETKPKKSKKQEIKKEVPDEIEDLISEDESFEDFYNGIAGKDDNSSGVNISKLTTYKQVLNLFQPELVEVCSKLGLNKKGSKSTLVNRVCENLGIKKK